jgi:hypothetical protein
MESGTDYLVGLGELGLEIGNLELGIWNWRRPPFSPQHRTTRHHRFSSFS